MLEGAVVASRIEYLGDVAVVVADGVFGHGSDTDQLQAVLTRVIVLEGCEKVLVDLSQAKIMSSIAIGVLAAARGSARKSGGRLVLCGLDPRLQKVLSVFHCFSQPFEIFDSYDDALEALKKL